MIYCAIIGDIIGSKKLSNRAEIQDLYRRVLEEINDKYVQYIASKFTITLGDEFQGLLNDAEVSYQIIHDIKRKMHPTQLVFGVGIGCMSTSINMDIAIGSDGPAYYFARDMIIRAKKKKPSICYYSGSSSDELINALIYFIETCSKRRSPRQKEAVELYKSFGSQEKVAIELNLSTQSTVSSLLSNAFYYEIENAEIQIKNYLCEYFCKENADHLVNSKIEYRSHDR